jgi:hypothetical protein
VLVGPGVMSMTVIWSAASQVTSSNPTSSRPAVKNSLSPDTFRLLAIEWSGPGKKSTTRTVPSAVPSLFQSSCPASASAAEK